MVCPVFYMVVDYFIANSIPNIVRNSVIKITARMTNAIIARVIPALATEVFSVFPFMAFLPRTIATTEQANAQTNELNDPIIEMIPRISEIVAYPLGSPEM